MCCYQTLYHNPVEGYVILCRQCDHIQVGYGNFALTLTRESFRSLQAYMQDCGKEINTNPAIRTIRIPTPCEGLYLLLSYDELRQFAFMLDTAESEMQSLELLQLFQPPLS